jgi:hypothetical protein
LDVLKKAGSIAGWDRQIRWPLVVNGVRVCTIVPDFRVWTSNTEYEFRECKGYAQPVWKLKRKLFEALHPDIPYVVIPAREALALPLRSQR